MNTWLRNLWLVIRYKEKLHKLVWFSLYCTYAGVLFGAIFLSDAAKIPCKYLGAGTALLGILAVVVYARIRP